MSFHAIASLVGLISLFGLIISLVGFFSLDNAYRKEYATSTYHMADSAAAEVNGDHLGDYLFENELTKDEYQKTVNRLQTSCYKLNVSLIYVIVVDTSDYGRFTSVFNVVNNDVDNTKYTPWALGYQRNTTNDEYREKYRSIYERRSNFETIFRTNTTDGQHPHITTLVPVLSSSRTVAGLLCMQRPISEMNRAMLPYLMAIVFSIVIMAVVISVLAALFVNKSIIKPVKRVSLEAARFAKESSIAAPLGEISRYEVISNLAKSIDLMEADTLKHMEELTSVTAERERIGAELSIASSIQRAVLPSVDSVLAGRTDFDIYASMNPAKGIGGDFYNFFFIDDDHLALIIADVSGKGVPAALFMMVSTIVLANRAQMGGSPAEILQYTNDSICRHNEAGMFVTVWLGILQLSTGELISANAGHEDPIIYRKKAGRFAPSPEMHGVVIGGMAGLRYNNQQTKLEKGDKLFIFTDGLSEAKNKARQMYSVIRVVKTLNENKDKTPKEILENMRDSVNAFVGDEPQFDDLTMLCIELK